MKCGPKPKSAADRFWLKVARDPETECWEWCGTRYPNGYGQFDRRGAHRFAYELLVGPIPTGLVIDHLCSNPGCVNPAHLQPVTCRINVLRGAGISARNARKTHCLRGHLFNETNTYWWHGERQCRVCFRERHRVYMEQRAIREGRKFIPRVRMASPS